MNKWKYEKFVILGTARTGTTMLLSYLNSHPEILCLRGVFGATNKINFGKKYDNLPDECTDQKLIENRNTKPREFIQKYVFKNYSENYKAVGLKYFYDHDRHLLNKNELIDYFTENNDIKFIHIKRDNLLAILYSYKRALSNQNWHLQEKTNFKTEIKIKECENYFTEIKKQYKRFDKLFGDRIFSIVYEDFVKKPTKILQELQNFLNVSPKIQENGIKKNINLPLSQAIINYTELKTHFKNTEFEIFFEAQTK